MVTMMRRGREAALLIVSIACWACAKPDSSGLFGPAQPLATDVASNVPTSNAPSSGEAGGNQSGAIAETPRPVELSESIPSDLAGGKPATESSSLGPDAAAAPAPSGEVAVDAGVDAAPPAVPTPPPACVGQPLGGICWYLAGDQEACADFCAAHGGFSEASLATIGTPAQGGSLEGCASVLQALEIAEGAAVVSGFREDGLGFGCHVLTDAAGAPTSAWWLTAPDFSPAAFGVQVRLACGCAR
jgi:hypothetical protein